jgi:nitroimidazol reductase NimA-like FMN-containing flavoprotein (pyridoxamine 5'-phosphate oxidase superfamily)
VHETEDDLSALQDLLDRSFAAAGQHLLEVITPENRMTAPEVCDRLQGVRLLALATATADGRPLVGPVDGVFYRGSFHFSSSPDSLRIRHLRRRPQVSATHVPEESFAVTVHGEGTLINLTEPPGASLRATLLDLYVPRYGPEWEQFLDANVCARIEARRMFVFHMPLEP